METIASQSDSSLQRRVNIPDTTCAGESTNMSTEEHASAVQLMIQVDSGAPDWCPTDKAKQRFYPAEKQADSHMRPQQRPYDPLPRTSQKAFYCETASAAACGITRIACSSRVLSARSADEYGLVFQAHDWVTRPTVMTGTGHGCCPDQRPNRRWVNRRGSGKPG